MLITFADIEAYLILFRSPKFETFGGRRGIRLSALSRSDSGLSSGTHTTPTPAVAAESP